MIDVQLLATAESERVSTVYAVGDIHGRLDLLEMMEMAIAQDVADTRPAHPLICYLGDYIDRGPCSAGVIDRLCRPFEDGIARVFLKGNHEDRMVAFLDDPTGNGPSWVKFGGREALNSYGVAVPDDAAAIDWLGLRDGLHAVLPEAHRLFLIDLRLGWRWRDFLFVHAGIDPARPMAAQASHDLMWIREPFLSSDGDWGFTVVHGHVVTETPVFRPNRIGIDTGAYSSGRLTCLVVSDAGARLIQTTGAGSER